MSIDVEALRVRLIARRDELEGLSEMAKDSRAAVELDQSMVGRLSRMDALQGQAMAQETERRRQSELARIRQVLELIDQDPDEVGYCATCGEEIGEKRLELDPATLVCVDCAG